MEFKYSEIILKNKRKKKVNSVLIILKLNKDSLIKEKV